MSTLGKLEDEIVEGVRNFAEWAKDRAEEEIKIEMKIRINDFWIKQPWYVRLFKPMAMQQAYRIWKDVIK